MIMTIILTALTIIRTTISVTAKDTEDIDCRGFTGPLKAHKTMV